MLQQIDRIHSLIEDQHPGHMRSEDSDEILYHLRNIKKQLNGPVRAVEEVFEYAGMNWIRSHSGGDNR